jgi:hypothetical protein
VEEVEVGEVEEVIGVGVEEVAEVVAGVEEEERRRPSARW